VLSVAMVNPCPYRKAGQPGRFAPERFRPFI
jgi:hypothetical protein